MKATLIFSILIITLVSNVSGQTISDFSVKVTEMGKGQLKKAPKKVYIASFNVYFELYKEGIDYKSGGSTLGGGVKSDATARAAVGLSGVEANDIQDKTNQLYNEFTAQLKAAGLEIISSDVAAKAEVYEGWEKASGPYIGESGIPNLLVSLPEGHSQYSRGKKDNGKNKKGMFDQNLLPARLSNNLDDAIIANVNLYYMFAEEGNNAFSAGGAKVKILTNLRMVGDFTLTAPDDEKKLFKMKGAQTFTTVKSAITFHQGKKGMGSPVIFEVSPKKDIEVEGVLKKEKVVAFQKQGSSTPTSFSGISYMDTADRFSENATWIEVDSKKYADGLYMVSKRMIDTVMSSLVANL